jgi:hypothetical protein
MNDYLTKPFTLELLAFVLEKWTVASREPQSVPA